MPYESFKCSHQLSIRGLVQDRQTGSWRYLIQVKRVMQDDMNCTEDSGTSAAGTTTTPLAGKVLWRRRRSSSFTPASPTTSSSSAFGAGNAYSIRRSFSEFKLLHAAMTPIMARALPSLPQESVFAFFLGETQTMLQKKRLALENILIAIENHSAASDATEYLEFLARTDTYDQVSRALGSPPPLSSSGFQAEDLVPKRYHSDDTEQHQQQRGRRRRSIESASQQDTDQPAAPAKENRVDFHRYSLM